MWSIMTRFLILFSLILSTSSSPVMAQLYSRGQFVRDLTMGIEWLRCSVGQRWSEDTQSCLGDIIPLDFDLIDQAITQANAQLGGGWRLPTEDELVVLICSECGIPMIDPKTFPNTWPDSYWTSDRNSMSSRHQVSVNFRTGYSYARFLRTQLLAVRLVRDSKR
jgi:hypothetical protein